MAGRHRGSQLAESGSTLVRAGRRITIGEGCETMVRTAERREHNKHRKSPTDASVVAGTGPTGLGVPRLAQKIPTVLRSPGRDIGLARLALLMLDSGMIPEADMVRSRRRLEAICANRFASWIASRLGKLKVFSPNFTMIVQPADDDSKEGGLCLAWGASKVETILVGPAMRALAFVHPRLPGTVLAAVRRAGWNSIPVFGFDEQLDICEGFLWGGAEDAAEYAEQMEMDEDEAKAFVEAVISRDQVTAQTPLPVFSSWRHRLRSPRRLGALRSEADDLPIRRVIELTMTLANAPMVGMMAEFHQAVAQEAGDFIGHGAILRWSESDLTPDVYQQFGEYLYNNGCGVEDACVCHLSLVDHSEFQHYMREFARSLETLQVLDELLWLLCAEEWSSYPHH